MMSAMAEAWSGVSSNGNAASKARYSASIAGSVSRSVAARCAYKPSSSSAISRTLRLTLALVLLNVCPPRRSSLVSALPPESFWI